MFDLPEVITVWNKGANDGHGNISWLGPFEYASRQALTSQKFTDVNGDQLMSTAVCYSEGAELKIGSLVFFGSSALPIPVDDANDVRQISQIPSGAGDMKKVWFA